MIIPNATYRIQFNNNFTLQHFENIIGYLDKLGIDTIYASPLLQAGKGSEHCYNVTDPGKINPEIGTEELFVKISKQLKEREISWLQDIVPNHMSFSGDNERLMDVLERGMNSSYAHYFDIDWQHPECRNKLMVPFLDGKPEDLLQNDQLRLVVNDEAMAVAYYDNLYPLRYESVLHILEQAGVNLSNAGEYLSKLATADLWQWQKIKHDTLATLLRKKQVQQIIEVLNKDKNALKKILDEQHYVLCDYRDSGKKMNYRRFFSINSLICLRMEDERVFNDYHQYIHSLYKRGLVHGLRIDHIDGLKDPATYIQRLRKLFGNDCYIIAEKILDTKEVMPPMLEVEGTSGYEFLSYTNQLLTDLQGSEKILEYYKSLVPEASDFYELVYQKKLAFLKTSMQGEWDNLVRMLIENNIINSIRDEEVNIKEALAVFMASFPVYRIYANKFPIEQQEKDYINEAFDKALKHAPQLQRALHELKAIFEKETEKHMRFIQRLMQFTGPLAAKGVEDTTFYIYNPLIGHNEVGDQPCELGVAIDAFHDKMQLRSKDNPLSLNCTSTHDTKRGEDNRIRINLVSEMPDEWIAHVEAWRRMNQPHKKFVKNIDAPSVNDEYMLYQSLLGSIDIDAEIDETYIERTCAFFTKAIREAKVHTTHDNPQQEYEDACIDFIKALLHSETFMQSFRAFAKKIIQYTYTHSLSQVVIKSTAPGIPDFYQGCELWNLSYVDPDNRRAVDYDKLNKMLNTILAAPDNFSLLQHLQNNKAAGAQKLFTTHRLLQLRKQFPDVFSCGEYIEVVVPGTDRHLLAYARKKGDQYVLVMLPLNIANGQNDFKDVPVVLPQELPVKLKNIFTNEVLDFNEQIVLKSLFEHFPVAVYVNG